MDIVLNGKLNGLEAATQIRSRSDIPIVFITGFEEEALAKRMNAITSTRYLIKPITPKMLLSAITEALRISKGDRL